MKKVPERTCCVTKEKLPKQKLLRIVRVDGNPVIDETGKANGRGAYVKRSADVALKAKKTKALDRALEIKVSDEFYDSLVEYLK